MNEGLDIHMSAEPVDKCKDCKYAELCGKIRQDISKENPYKANKPISVIQETSVYFDYQESRFNLNDTLYKTLEYVGYWMTHGKKPDVESIRNRLDAYACILQTVFGVDLSKIERWYK